MKITISFSCALVLFIVLAAWNIASHQKQQPIAEHGTLDLSGWNLSQDGPIKLNGEWEFYWNQLLYPTDFTTSITPKMTGFIDIPSSWNGYQVNGELLPGEGYATYRLTVLLNTLEPFAGLKFLYVSTAFNLYVNGMLVTAFGKVAQQSEFAAAGFHANIAYLNLTQKKMDIVLHVSNFAAIKGGLFQAIHFGKLHDIEQIEKANLSFELFLCGSILVMGIYHLGLFAIRRRESSPLYFAMLCFCIVVYTLTSGETNIHYMVPDMSWELCSKLNILSFYLSIPIFLMFLQVLYPNEFLPYSLKIIQLLGIIFAAIVIVTPTKIHAYTLQFYEIIAISSLLYAVYILILGVLRKREGSAIFLAGFLVVFVTIINDILYDNEIIHTGRLIPFGLFVFILSQSILLSSRFSQAFVDAERLFGDLVANCTKNTRLIEVFQKFVPVQFVHRIARQGLEEIKFGQPETAAITILFSDIRSFTTMAEAMSAEDLFFFLNAYFKRMYGPIHNNHGFIDKFIGDAIMVIFERQDESGTQQAQDAVQAAVDMQKALAIYNQERQINNYQVMQIGVGIHSGQAIIGTIGTEDRMESTVLGDDVNLASRLEGLTKYYGVSIVISYDTLSLLHNKRSFKYRELDWLKVKGKRTPVLIYEVYNADSVEIQKYKRTNGLLLKKGLYLRHIQEWDQAIAAFQEALQNWPDDVSAKNHIQRCEQLKQDPPAKDWNGAIQIDLK